MRLTHALPFASGVCLNEARPRRPEQSNTLCAVLAIHDVSMKSGLEGRNNPLRRAWSDAFEKSQ